ncbi:hypothetical protein IAR50_002792 [Cryptococcus sp. DSM 104548]
MPPPLHLPIAPDTPSLSDHLTALSTLSLNLSLLRSSPSPAVRVPLGAKASLSGTVSDTSSVLVCLGSAGSGGRWGDGEQYWVKMTPDEAAAFVDRRRERILREQARVIDGLGQREGDEASLDVREEPVTLWHPSFYPVGTQPPRATSQVSAAGATEQPALPAEPSLVNHTETSVARENDEPKASVRGVPGTNALPGAAPVQDKGKGKARAPEPDANDLIEIMTEGAAAASKDEKEAKDDGTIYNEEGLPFHEIRETMDGKTIGDLPPPSASLSEPTSSLDDAPDEYWTEAAVKRREALRKKLFHEGDSSEEEEESDNGTEPVPPTTEGEAAPKSTPKPAPPHSILRKTSSSSSTASSRSQTPSSQPKSILKAPSQKKSVKFDPSIPPSPSSPDHGPSSFQAQLARGNKFGFPLPLVADGDDWGEKPVPVLNEPKPKARGGATVLPIQAVGAQVVEKDDGFAGFKKGFLTGPPKVQAATAPSPQPAPVPEPPQPKKKSLFAKRLAHSEVDASAPPTSSGATPATASPRGLPNLPRESESKGTSAVKSGVVEKAPAAPTAPAQGKVVERAVPAPAATSKPKSSMPPIISLAPQQDDDYGDEDDGDDDEDFSEFSSGSEDEYDLDDALLAREVALEYHKRRAYMSLNRDPRDRAMSNRPEESGFAPEEGEFGEEEEDGRLGNLQQAGVVLGLPRIGDMRAEDGKPMIINPTGDDLKRFVRVGRLENGNLVLAPGQEGLSDSGDEGQDGEDGADGEDAEKEERRKEVKSRRDEVRRKLLGMDVEERGPADEKKPELSDRKGLPPALQTDVKEQSEPVAPVAAVEEPKKKVSRFKAARMAGGQ